MLRRLLAGLVALFTLAGVALATPLMGSSGISSTITPQYVFWTVGGEAVASATESDAPPFAVAGTAANLYISLTAAPGTSASRTFVVRINGVDSALTCTVTDPATTCTDLTHNAAIVAGDKVVLKATIGGGTATAARVASSVTFVPTVANETALFIHDAAYSTSATVYDSLAGEPTNSATEATLTQYFPTAGAISALYQTNRVAPGAAKSYTITARKNAADSALTCATSGAASTSCNDVTHSFSVALGDLVGYGITPSGTPTGSGGAGIGVKFVPTISGEFVILAAETSQVANATRYIAPISARASGATEATLRFVAPQTMTIRRMYATTTAPGTGETRGYTIRVNGVSAAMACTVAGVNTACSNALPVTLVAGDLFTIQEVSSAAAATGTGKISLVATLAATQPAGNLTTLGVGN